MDCLTINKSAADWRLVKFLEGSLLAACYFLKAGVVGMKGISKLFLKKVKKVYVILHYIVCCMLIMYI